ncbi:hypothetical protein EJP77_00910 [Paenibacillus zeisoli]|uniref:Arabinogalactan endo-beta-1,4-galactanase n=1 Tax=Paenibacillus zeisoli TaxID=2496267 RepID=A0A3S1BBI7_9BACL|nr:glycosyl hydrolase 53 family protein [Paenibacillus zeisoli]RUT35613.1 hypothetical protein EJP77_00910 [Paenibacillus zeisoli]
MKRGKSWVSRLIVITLLLPYFGISASSAEAAAVNLALNTTVTTSSEYTEWGSAKEHIVDGDTGTHWNASNADPGNWVVLDLGGTYSLSGADVLWKDETLVQFKIEASADNQNWSMVADQTGNASTQQLAALKFDTPNVRYVRLTINKYGDTGAWPGIKELRIWQKQEVKDPAAITGYDTVTTSTSTGAAPSLPNEILAYYQDGSSGKVNVVWEAVPPSSYSVTGTFTIKGAVEGSTVQPEASITVSGYREDFIRGVDISTLTAIEDHGGRYFDSNGVQRDLLDILKDRGVNYVRLRLWNDPKKSGGYNNESDVIRLAKRVKSKGLKLLVDFHYSDEWAHPGQQIPPSAWKDLSQSDLEKAVHDYTQQVVQDLKQVNAMPDMVQIGNEINSGVLNGLNSTPDFDKNAALLSSGVQGVRDVAGGDQVKIMIHLAEGGKYDTFKWYFGELNKRNVPYDIIGLSYYPFWHGTFADVQKTMNGMAEEFGKEVVIAETSYPFTFKEGDAHENVINSPSKLIGGATFPATVQGQYDAMKAVMEALVHVPDQKGAGFFYWEPAWITANVGWIDSEGDAWENQAMFDYKEFPANGGQSYAGYALNSLDVYKIGLPVMPTNRAELAAAIAKASSLVQADFADGSWEILQPALANASSKYNQLGLTQADADSAAESLSAVMSSLQINTPDKSILKTVIDEAKALKQADWSAVTWADLQTALSKAENVYVNNKVTQTEVNTAAASLRTAIDGLSNVDKTTLVARIAEAKTLDATSYSKSSWNKLLTAISAAEAVNTKANAVQTEVEAALTALQSAVNSLVPLQSLTAGAAVTSSSNAGSGGGKANSPEGAIDDNTTTSWGTNQGGPSWWKIDFGESKLLSKVEMLLWSGGLKYTIEISDDDDNYTKVIDTTSDVITTTTPKHVLPDNTKARYVKVTIVSGPAWVGISEFKAYGLAIADKSQLLELIEKANGFTSTKYTSASWNLLQQALLPAKETAADPQAQQSEVDHAVTSLNEAVNGLVLASTVSPGTPSGDSSGVPVSTSSQSESSANQPIISVIGSDIKIQPGNTTGDIHVSMEQLREAAAHQPDGQVSIIVQSAQAGKLQTVHVPAKWLSEQTNTQKESLLVNISGAAVSLNGDILSGLKLDDNSLLEISIAKVSSSSLPLQSASSIGNQSVYDFNLMLNGRKLTWNNRNVQVSLPYTLGSGETPEQVVVYHVNETGVLEPVKAAHYDKESGRVIFRPEHFSMYTAIRAPKQFSDLAVLPWAQGSVESMAAKGILMGNGHGQFEPGKAVTRAEFLQMLMKAMDLKAEGKAGGFTDVKASAWYYQVVSEAQLLGIVKGKKDGSFGANEAITRQDMAVLLVQALQLTKDKLVSHPVTGTFKDVALISDYATEAVTYGQRTQIIKGMGNGTFEPHGTATRAEAAVLLNRVMEEMSK